MSSTFMDACSGGWRKDPQLAVLLSVLPGLGQLYLGDRRKGALFLAATAINALLLGLIFGNSVVIHTLYDFASAFHMQTNAQLIQALRHAQFGTPGAWALIAMMLLFVLYAMRDARDDALAYGAEGTDEPASDVSAVGPALFECRDAAGKRASGDTSAARQILALSEASSGSYVAHVALMATCLILAAFFVAPLPAQHHCLVIDFLPQQLEAQDPPASDTEMAADRHSQNSGRHDPWQPAAVPENTASLVNPWQTREATSQAGHGSLCAEITDRTGVPVLPAVLPDLATPASEVQSLTLPVNTAAAATTAAATSTEPETTVPSVDARPQQASPPQLALPTPAPEMEEIVASSGTSWDSEELRVNVDLPVPPVVQGTLQTATQSPPQAETSRAATGGLVSPSPILPAYPVAHEVVGELRHRRFFTASGRRVPVNEVANANGCEVVETPVRFNASTGIPGNPNPDVHIDGPPSLAARAFADFGPYMAEMHRLLKWCWQPPRGYAALRAAVIFEVRRNGEMRDLRISVSSGSEVHDAAALKAVRSAAPLFKPLPEGAPEAVDIEFTFDYNTTYCAPTPRRTVYVGDFYATDPRQKNPVQPYSPHQLRDRF